MNNDELNRISQITEKFSRILSSTESIDRLQRRIQPALSVMEQLQPTLAAMEQLQPSLIAQYEQIMNQISEIYPSISFASWDTSLNELPIWLQELSQHNSRTYEVISDLFSSVIEPSSLENTEKSCEDLSPEFMQIFQESISYLINFSVDSNVELIESMLSPLYQLIEMLSPSEVIMIFLMIVQIAQAEFRRNN